MQCSANQESPAFTHGECQKEDKWYTYITFDEGLVESHEDEIIETFKNLMNNKFDLKSEE